ncbi:VOC family protein [Thiosulfatihalobacter marinus]|jgi:catechol 2,3-dioxygenase-like lactoylglutathione lyase family enzyme|uniref:VOC family protein n=1 Tax=Thiosulfatihalobacter marinus TaxID=2792481 RepID=UPI0018D9D65F|nr:VOC family protein [Thiosulfatihalobacter marinus]
MSAPIGQIAWVYTGELADTVAFYRDVLGLSVARDAGAAVILETAPGAFIGVCRAFADRVVQPEGGMITILVDGIGAVDAWYARIVAAGAPTRGAPERLDRFAIYSFFCMDPNGYAIEVQTFLDGRTLPTT